MKQIEFYILQQPDYQACLTQACRLIDKAYQAGRKVHIHLDDQTHANTLDDLLWTFRDNSFVPHNLIGEGPNTPPPVQIGYQDQQPISRDILLNLSLKVPNFSERFKHIIEIVPQDETYKAALREHYRYYRQQGFQIETHQL